MVAYYQIAGKKVGSHVLSMATLGALFGGVWLSSRGGAEKKKEQGPPVVAASKDEEQFIQQFLKDFGSEENKAKH